MSSFISWLSVRAIFRGGAEFSPSISTCSWSLFFAAFCLDRESHSEILQSLRFWWELVSVEQVSICKSFQMQWPNWHTGRNTEEDFTQSRKVLLLDCSSNLTVGLKYHWSQHLLFIDLKYCTNVSKILFPSALSQPLNLPKSPKAFCHKYFLFSFKVSYLFTPLQVLLQPLLCPWLHSLLQCLHS